MKITLFDFQKEALHALRTKLLAARQMAALDNPQAIVFSAPTGSGKTVIMTALFEAMLSRPDDQLDWPLDWQPDPQGVILWVSDMPELNEQTRRKIESQSDRIGQASRLVVIDSSFDAERLAGGRIYFVNTQKLGSDKLLTRHGDGRQYTLWETFSNTVRAVPKRFLVVIDEAHRGMTSGQGATQARTLMQRFILGDQGSGMLQVPLLLGMSATPQRFSRLLEQAPHTVHKVPVGAEAVRASGLLKERILIDHPEAPTQSSMTLLAEAARRWQEMTARWQRYCEQEGLAAIWPVLVVQVQNKSGNNPTATDLPQALATIEDAIGRPLRESEVVHTLHDAGDMDVGGRRVRRMEAARIQDDKDVGVVLFKTSLSTGWDCPRAEVMMSFRRAEDYTYIAQLLGRTVRTPLARRVEGDAALNDVHLFLPHFDRESVELVVQALKNEEDVPPSEAGAARDLIILQRAHGSDEAFVALAHCVVYRVNAVRAQPALRRYVKLATQLNVTGIVPNAPKTTREDIFARMDEQLQIMRADGSYDKMLKGVVKVRLSRLVVQGQGVSMEAGEEYEIGTSDVDIERHFNEAGRRLGHGLHVEWLNARVDDDLSNLRDVKLDLIAMARSETAMQALQKAATAAFDRLYDTHKIAIGKLPEAARQACLRLRLASAEPVALDWRLPANINWRRKPDEPLWRQHLYVEENGEFRCELGSWEAPVLQQELDRGAVWWLRNQPRQPWSLEIPYRIGGVVKPMYPDLVVLHRHGEDLVASILEPHDPGRDDNFEKAVGLAEFAGRHGHLFGRIELIREQTAASGGKMFRRLNLNSEAVRKKILPVTSNPQLDAVFSELST